MSSSSVITSYYQAILSRAPSASELTSWASSVDSSALTLAQVRAALIGSSEATNFVDPVLRLYEAAFGRAPESSAAIDFYADLLRSGAATVSDIAGNFAASPEFAARFGSGGPSGAFITALYLNVLGRAPVAAEVDWYQASGMSAARMLEAFSQSPEFQARSAAAVDAFLDGIALGDQVFTGSIFRPTYALTSSAEAVVEGNAVVFTLQTANVPVGTSFDYTIAGVSAADVVGAQLSGTAIVGADGKAVVSIQLMADFVAEGAETLSLQVAGQTKSVVVNDASAGIFVLTSSADTVGEGSTVVFTLQTTGVPAGTSFDYVISGVSAADVLGGQLSGTAIVRADGKAEVSVQLVADRLTEGDETLSLQVAGQTKTVTVLDTSGDPAFDLTVGQDNFADTNKGSAADNLYVGRVSSDDAVTTFSEGDRIDGGGGADTLRLFMSPGTVADGVEVSSIETLDLRLSAATNPGSNQASELVMTDWDASLQQVNIRSNKSNLVVSEQKTIAAVSIVDGSTAAQNSSYTLGYTAGLLDGASDHLSLSVDNVNGADGSNVGIDGGMEEISINVADRAGTIANSNLYASDINLSASGVRDVTVTGGRTGQTFTLDADVAGGAEFDSTAFAGNMELTSGDIKTALLGAGDDVVTVTDQADESDSRYDLGEGDNQFTFLGQLGGRVTSGSGVDYVGVLGTADGSSIIVGGGDNAVDIGGAHAGDVEAGDGDDNVSVLATVAGSSINVGDGTNEVNIALAHAGDVEAGDGDDDVGARSTEAGSSIVVGNGTNTVTIIGAHAGDVLAGDGDDDVDAGSTAADSSIDVGDGANTVTIIGAHAGSVLAGDDDDTITVGTGINGGSISTGAGSDAVTVSGDVTNGSINVGEGDGNTVSVTGSVTAGAPGTISFGDGDNNSLSIGEDLIGDAVVFGDGAGNAVDIGGDVLDGASLQLGNGGNTVTIGGGAYYASISFGTGNDTLTADAGIYTSIVNMGDGADTLNLLNGNDDYGVGYNATDDAAKTMIDMGSGNDLVNITSDGGNLGVDYGYIYSGGSVDGGAGNDKLVFSASDSARLIGRDNNQLVTVDYSEELFTLGQTITVTFERGDDTFEVDYTVVESDFIQGPEGLAAKVAQSVAAQLNADEAFDALFGASAADGVLTIESDQPLEDFVLSSSVGEVEVVQLSDAEITSVETIDLVALNSVGEDNITINADFELIEGTTDINLISQVERDETAQDEELNGAYTQYTQDGPTTFQLVALNGGEAITVSGHETSATGNSQVSRIFVDSQDDDHVVGETISVTINDVTVDYVVTAADLNGDTGLLDANQIAASLAAAITSAATAAGLTVSVDPGVEAGDPVRPHITLMGQPGVDFNLAVAHTRFEEVPIVNESGVDESYAIAAIMTILRPGDVITVTVGDDEATYTVTEEDCDRLESDAIVAHFKDALGLGGDWGVLTSADSATLTITRMTDLVGDDQTYAELVQPATNIDDSTADVVIAATLAADATNTTMDLTVAGEGDFDIAITGGEDVLIGALAPPPVVESGFTDLVLTLADGFDHTINTGGVGFIDAAPIGNFADTIIVSDASGVNTTGSNIVLEDVLAHTVTSTSLANLTIDQYATRDVAQPEDEVITVTTGAGDDHLTTLAQSALTDGSSINLGSGRNTLSLGWGEDATLDSADLEDVGSINYSGDLTQLDILNDVVLDQARTTLTMPGGVGDVEKLTFADVSSADPLRLSDVQRLQIDPNKVILGVVFPDWAPVTWANFNNAQEYYRNLAQVTFGDTTGVANDLSNLLVEVNGYYFVLAPNGEYEIDGYLADFLNQEYGAGSFDFDAAVENLLVSTDLVIVGAANDFTISSTDDFEVDGALIIQDAAGVEITGDLLVQADDEVEINIGNVRLASITVNADDDIEVEYAHNDGGTFVVGDVLLVSDTDDADFQLEDNNDTSVTVGDVTAVSDEDSDLEIERNSGLTATLGNVVLTADEDADVSINRNTDSSITMGSVSVTQEGTDDDSAVQFSANSGTTAVMGPLTVDLATGSYDAELLIGEGGGEDGNTDSSFTVNGPITMSAHDDVSLDVKDNEATNVSLAVGSVITLTACQNSGVIDVELNRNVNNHDPLGPDPLSDEFIQSYAVILGDMVMDAGDYADLDIIRNEDNTYFGEMSVTVGDVQMFTHDYAELSVLENDSVTVTIGDMDLRAQTFVELIIDDNDGRIYDNTLSNPPREEPDYAVVNIGDITSVSDGRTYFGIGENDLAQITVGDVSLTAGEDAGIEIVSNTDEGIGEDLDAAQTEITLGDVTIDAQGLAGLTVGLHYSGYEDDDDDNFFGPSGEFEGGNINAIIDLGAVSLTASGVAASTDLVIANNRGEDARGTVDIDSVDMTSEGHAIFFVYNNMLGIDQNELLAPTLTVGDVVMAADGNANFAVTGNGDPVALNDPDNAAGFTFMEFGDISLTANSGEDVDTKNAQVDITNNVFVRVETGDVALTGNNTGLFVNDNGRANFLLGDVELTSTGEDDYLADVTVNDNFTSDVEMGTVTIYSDDDALIAVDGNSAGGNTDDTIVTMGSVDVDADGGARFFVTDNSDTDVTIAIDVNSDDGRDTITIDAAYIGDYGSEADGFAVLAGEDTDVVLGHVSLTAAGEDTVSDVNVAITVLDADSSIDMGDLTVNADGDAYVTLRGGAGNDLTVGDIVIDAGLDQTLLSSELYFRASDLNGNSANSGEDRTQTITLSASSGDTGDGFIHAVVHDAVDLSALTISGTHAEVYLTGDIGTLTEDTTVFSLDLSGLTGAFENGANNFDPLYQGEDNQLNQDVGIYVETFDADFGSDVVRVTIGEGDMIYNAHHSSWDADNGNNWGATRNADEDGPPWDVNEDGWYSLGDDGDFSPSAMVQTINLTGDNEWVDDVGNTLSIDYDNQTYTFTIGEDEDQLWFRTDVELDAGDTGIEIGDTGLTIRLSGEDSFIITGTPDGAEFEAISEYSAEIGLTDAEVTSGSSSIVQENPAEDNHGQLAKEIFTFTGDTVGEIVIGGFNPGQWGQANPENGRLTDQLDFSQFNWDGDDLTDDAGLVNLNYFSFLVEDGDGYFKDVVIDFIGGAGLALGDVNFGSIRLVGVGEFDNATQLVQDSIIFA